MFYYLVAVTVGGFIGTVATLLLQQKSVLHVVYKVRDNWPFIKKVVFSVVWLIFDIIVIIEVRSNWSSFIELKEISSWEELFKTLARNKAIFHVITFGTFLALIAITHFIVKFGFLNWGEIELFGIKARQNVQEAKKEANSELMLNREMEWIRIRILEALSQEGTYYLIVDNINEEGLDGQALLHEVVDSIRYHYQNSNLRVNVNVGFLEVTEGQLDRRATEHLNTCVLDALDITTKGNIPRVLTEYGHSTVAAPIIFGEDRDLYYLLYLHSDNSEKLEFDKRDEAMLLMIGNNLNSFFARAWSEREGAAVI